MCGSSDYKINGEEYVIFLDWGYGDLLVNNESVYRMDSHLNGSPKRLSRNRTAAKSKLSALGADNLAELILGWVENAEEA